MKNARIVFFGTPHYSLLVLEPMHKSGFKIVCVVTKPPLPVGRKQILTPSAVAEWATAKQIPILTPKSNGNKPWQFADEEKITHEILKYKPDVLVSADYSQKIPSRLIAQVKHGGLNVHPSLLPAYRGPAPVPWAILKGEKETGVSIVTLSEKFDEGVVVAQVKEPILVSDTTDSLLTKLFTKGGEMLVSMLQNYCHPELVLESHEVNKEMLKSQRDPLGQVQHDNKNMQPSYFPRLTRNYGYIPWEIIKSAMKGVSPDEKWLAAWPIAKYFDNQYLIHHSQFIILNSYRALHPWPGIWTKVRLSTVGKDTSGVTQRSSPDGRGFQEKRLKLLKVNLHPTYLASRRATNLPAQAGNLQLISAQLEGKQPASGKDAQKLLHTFF